MSKRRDRRITGVLGFYAPRFWFAWFVVGLSWTLAKIPASVQQALYRGLARLAIKTNTSRLKIIRRNIELCFPELTHEESEELVFKNLCSTLMTLTDVVSLLWLPKQSILDRGRIIGEEHLHEAIATNKPILVITGHSTCFLLALTQLAEIKPFSALYRRLDNPVLDDQLPQRLTSNIGMELIHRKKVAYMLQKLADNGMIAVLPDQDFGPKRSIFVPFFGLDCATIPSISQYATTTGAKVLLMYEYREADGKYAVEFEPALENYPSGDDRADSELWTNWLEGKIREHPEHYLWMHKRFKTRPEGQAKLY